MESSFRKLLRSMLEREHLLSGDIYYAGRKTQREAFFGVLECGDISDLQFLIDHGIDPFAYADDYPLLRVAVNSQTEVLEFLLSMGHFDPNQVKSPKIPIPCAFGTPLCQAVHCVNYKAVKLLLDNGALPSLPDGRENTPLRCVDYYDPDPEVTEILKILLLHKADCNAVDGEGKSVLFHAATANYNPEHSKRLKLLLEHGADRKLNGFLQVASRYKALRAIVEHYDLETVQKFLELGIDLAKCKKHQLLVHAARNPNVEVLEYLLNTDLFDPEEQNQSDGFRPLHTAAGCNNPEAVKLLLEWGVEVNPETQEGYTPLQVAVSYYYRRRPETEDACARCIELLLFHGADVNAKINGGPVMNVLDAVLMKYRGWSLERSIIPVCARPIITHTNMMVNQNRSVDSVYFHPMYAGRNESCQAELAAMKEEILVDPISLYDVLAGGYGSSFANKKKVMQKLQDLEYITAIMDRFPICGRKLIVIMESWKELESCKEVAAKNLSILVGLGRDSLYMIIDNIISMLNKKNLRALSRVRF